MKIPKFETSHSISTTPYALAYSGQLWLWIFACLVFSLMESRPAGATLPDKEVVNNTGNQSELSLFPKTEEYREKTNEENLRFLAADYGLTGKQERDFISGDDFTSLNSTFNIKALPVPEFIHGYSDESAVKNLNEDWKLGALYQENSLEFQEDKDGKSGTAIVNESSVLKDLAPVNASVLAQNPPFPAPPPPPTPTPGQLPPPDQLLTPSEPVSPPQQEIPDRPVPGKIFVERFEVEGSTVFSKEELAKVLEPFTKKELTFAEILQARSAITQLYVEKGYITSGALIPTQALDSKVVKIQVVEGALEGINVVGLRRLNPSYVRSRIALATRKPLNVPRLLDALRVLQLDPLIQNLSAELSAGSRPGFNVLDLQVREADTFSGQITLDNGRSPSVGSFRRRAQITQANLLGFGDGFVFGYTNTDGSNGVDLSYTFPINARNGSLNFAFGTTSSNVIERPFSRLDIISDSRYYELTYRQPIVQTPSTEFSLGLTASRRESETLLLDRPFPLAQGADEQGRTRISSLRFFQEWTNRSSSEVLAARSQFNLGFGAFDATINAQGPDTRFFSWRGQAQWVRRLAPDTLFLIRGDVQLADRPLVPTEQFGLGGLGSVRGYRQDFLLTDNGALLSAEVRFPIYKTSQTLLSVVPFVDFGTVWNSGGRDNPAKSTLSSVGLGLQFVINDYLTARLDWGIPLVSVDAEKRTWQENGIYFSITANPF